MIEDISKYFSLAHEAFEKNEFMTAQMLSDKVVTSLKGEDLLAVDDGVSEAKNSIIIVIYQLSDNFILNLNELKYFNDDPDYELLIVDNGCPGIEEAINATGVRCKLIKIGFNYGASGARNVASWYAGGENLVFIDDDGLIKADSIISLVSEQVKHSAISVRGRVVPITAGKSVTHYDKGDQVIVSVPDTEGIALWRKKQFSSVSGYDPLLFGHEGLELYARLYKYHGARKFIYTPNAVLKHDFDDGPKKLEAKTRRYKFNRSYLEYKKIDWKSLVRSTNEFNRVPCLRYSFLEEYSFSKENICFENKKSEPEISIITTNYNSEEFIEEYTASLKGQTFRDFEVIFVDDGSEDNSVDCISSLWKGDSRLKLFRSDHVGRAAALNIALEKASGRICVIADADDISNPDRLKFTHDYFRSKPEMACLGFLCFNEENVVRSPRPFPTLPSRIRARALTGMPVSFPTFAFRRSLWSSKFDESLEGGIDCNWLFANLVRDTSLDGEVIPLQMVYYRLHAGQITTTKRKVQEEQAITAILNVHSQILSHDAGIFIDMIEKLSGWKPLKTGGEVNALQNYVYKLLDGNRAANWVANKHAAFHFQELISDLKTRRMTSDYRFVKDKLEKLTRTQLEPIQPKQANNAQWIDVSTNWGPLHFRKLIVPFALPILKKLGSREDLSQFKRDPASFLINLKPSNWKKFGLFLFPPR